MCFQDVSYPRHKSVLLLCMQYLCFIIFEFIQTVFPYFSCVFIFSLLLLLSKGNTIEIWDQSEDGLTKTTDLSLYGRVIRALLFRPPNCSTDHLFILTQRFQFCILAFDSKEDRIITKASGSAEERLNNNKTEGGPIVIIDPSQTKILLHIYKGAIDLLPLTKDGTVSREHGVGGAGDDEAYQKIPITELDIFSLAFLYKSKSQTQNDTPNMPIHKFDSTITPSQLNSNNNLNIETNTEKTKSSNQNDRAKSNEATADDVAMGSNDNNNNNNETTPESNLLSATNENDANRLISPRAAKAAALMKSKFNKVSSKVGSKVNQLRRSRKSSFNASDDDAGISGIGQNGQNDFSMGMGSGFNSALSSKPQSARIGLNDNLNDFEMIGEGSGLSIMTNNENELEFCVLYREYDGSRHLKTYLLDLNILELRKGKWETLMVEEGCHTLISVPPPCCGVIFIGQYSIAYRNRDNCQRVQVPDGEFTCHAAIDKLEMESQELNGNNFTENSNSNSNSNDNSNSNSNSNSNVKAFMPGTRFLLGDALTRSLNIVVLRYNNDYRVCSLSFEKLGSIVSPSCISYLDNGYVFVGSCAGNHQLVKIHKDKEWKKRKALEEADSDDEEEEDEDGNDGNDNDNNDENEVEDDDIKMDSNAGTRCFFVFLLWCFGFFLFLSFFFFLEVELFVSLLCSGDFFSR